MTAITRRAALGGMASLSAVGGAGAALAAKEPHDPILDALEAYREGVEAYERHPILNKVNSTAEENEAAVAATYGPALAVLHAWEQPAVTRSGAIAALRYALDEGAGDVGDGVCAMIEAALGYLESGASS